MIVSCSKIQAILLQKSLSGFLYFLQFLGLLTMEQDTSKIQIRTNQLDIKASNLSTESIQNVLDFVTINQKNQMKNESKANLQALFVGLILSLILGITIYSIQSIQLINDQESITDVE